MKKYFKKIMVAFVALTLCLAISVTAFAGSGYNGANGYSRDFDVYLSSGGSKGQVTIRVQSPSDAYIYFRITDQNGRTVFVKDYPGISPNNGNEIKSSVFTSCIPGNYHVKYTTLEDVRFDCWVYSWD